MKLVVDHIEDDIVVCEDLKTQKLFEIERVKLPNNISDGTMLEFKNDQYELLVDEEKERRENLRERFNRLKEK